MADGLPSPEEFEKWLLPPDALALVEKTYGAPGARVAIMERLHAKIIDAISPSTSFTKGDTEPTHTKELIPVPARYWKYIHDESTFWQNGDAMFFTSDPRTSEAYITRCFGIKLDPADVGTIPHRPVAERLDQKAAPAEHATLASESDGSGQISPGKRATGLPRTSKALARIVSAGLPRAGRHRT